MTKFIPPQPSASALSFERTGGVEFIAIGSGATNRCYVTYRELRGPEKAAECQRMAATA